mgnify:CR=1 FL=1
MHTSREKSEFKGVADRWHKREDAELFQTEYVIVVLGKHKIRILMVVKVVD